MRTYLWLDDIRDPNFEIWQIQYMPDYTKGVDEIIWVKTYKEFVEWISKNGLPDEVFFDHDLADNWDLRSDSDVESWFDMNNNLEYTGYDAAKWLGNYCIDNKLKIPMFSIQSANPVGARNIREYLNNCKKFISEN